jgi:anti-sigma factor RsiW
MDDQEFQQIKETTWRRALRQEEAAAMEQFLEAHPAERRQWLEEAALNRLLDGLPAVPVSSNFTARMLQAAQRARALPTWRDWLSPEGWLPQGQMARVAMCSMMVCLGVFSFREYQGLHRARMAREVADVSRVAALPPMEWLKDFDTINKLNQVKVADDDLLAALR